MRIGIDARMLGPEQSGLGRYVEQLINHLVLIDQKNQYVLFVRDQSKVKGQWSNVRSIVADIPWYSFAEQIKFTSIIKEARITSCISRIGTCRFCIVIRLS